MPVYLVRHAHAGKRSQWDGDDTARPVSERGSSQSRGVAELLADAGIGRVVSSPYVRCVQTVEPLASAQGVAVETDDRLAEGADSDAAVALLLELESTNGVACSHGDLIPPVLHRLLEMGMVVDGDGSLPDQKGSVWRIDLEDGRPVRACYTGPTA